jgi:broad specificity phosphatase PhoE
MERGRWLRSLMLEKWPNLSPELRTWRQGVLDALLALNEDSVVFTHFIAINVAVGHATGEEHVVCSRPANGSVTVLETNGTYLALVERGVEGITEVR